MASLADIYVKIETLETLLKTLKAKNEKGINITVSQDDKTNEYGSNVSAYVSQSKEDREAKKNKFYVGNGKVFWTNGTVSLAEKRDKGQRPAQAKADDDDDLPF
jgi:hypothetical protein